MFKRKGGGVKGLLNNVKKTALFSRDGFPNNLNSYVPVTFKTMVLNSYPSHSLLKLLPKKYFNWIILIPTSHSNDT